MKYPGNQTWTEIHKILMEELDRRIKLGDAHFKSGFHQSKGAHEETRLYNAALKTFQLSSIVVSTNAYLLDIFEGDVVLHLPMSPVSRKLILNIELDGLMHNRERKRRFCKMRDNHLRSHGIAVTRIKSSHLRRMNDDDIRDWLLETVASTLLNQ